MTCFYLLYFICWLCPSGGWQKWDFFVFVWFFLPLVAKLNWPLHSREIWLGPVGLGGFLIRMQSSSLKKMPVSLTFRVLSKGFLFLMMFLLATSLVRWCFAWQTDFNPNFFNPKPNLFLCLNLTKLQLQVTWQRRQMSHDNRHLMLLFLANL